jgi:hypothetical protein
MAIRNTLDERSFDSFVEDPLRANKTAMSVYVTNPSGGIAATEPNQRQTTVTTAATDFDDVIICLNTTAITIFLPADYTKTLLIIQGGVGAVTLQPNGADDIIGQSSMTLSSQYSSVSLIKNASTWYVT